MIGNKQKENGIVDLPHEQGLKLLKLAGRGKWTEYAMLKAQYIYELEHEPRKSPAGLTFFWVVAFIFAAVRIFI